MAIRIIGTVELAELRRRKDILEYTVTEMSSRIKDLERTARNHANTIRFLENSLAAVRRAADGEYSSAL